MSNVIQPGAAVYTQSFGTRPENLEVPTLQSRSPATTDVNWPVGKQWVDTTNNATWQLTSLSAFNGTVTANWVQNGGNTGAVSSVLGTANQVTVSTTGDVATVSLPTGVVAPGSVTTTTFVKSGSYIASAPSNSSVVTTAFVTSLTAGTSVQNTNAYDLICNICVQVSAATTATIVLGVGSATGPTTNTVIPSFTVAAATFFTFSAYVPAGYYLVYNTTGTITVTSATVQAMGV